MMVRSGFTCSLFNLAQLKQYNKVQGLVLEHFLISSAWGETAFKVNTFLHTH